PPFSPHLQPPDRSGSSDGDVLHTREQATIGFCGSLLDLEYALNLSPIPHRSLCGLHGRFHLFKLKGAFGFLNNE
ncbi:hypothetical protein Csa_023879, partial [Cucumis sativus]